MIVILKPMKAQLINDKLIQSMAVLNLNSSLSPTPEAIEEGERLEVVQKFSLSFGNWQPYGGSKLLSLCVGQTDTSPGRAKLYRAVLERSVEPFWVLGSGHILQLQKMERLRAHSNFLNNLPAVKKHFRKLNQLSKGRLFFTF